MAKSKKQKRSEALVRNRDNYAHLHLMAFINRSPIGNWWEGTERDMCNHIQDIFTLRRLSKELEVTMTGSDTAWSSQDQWSIEQLVNSLLIHGTLHQFVIDCNETITKSGREAIEIESPDKWPERLAQVKLLLQHPSTQQLLKLFKEAD